MVAVALLALSASFTYVARDDVDAFPTIDGHTPSGFLAFAELARAEGYEVVLDRSTHPKLSPTDVPLVVELVATSDFAIGGTDDEDGKAFAKILNEHVNGGGTVLWVTMAKGFQDASAATSTVEAKQAKSGQPFKVLQSKEVTGKFFPVKQRAPLWLDQAGTPLASLWGVDKGTVVKVEDGLAFTNRYITESDDAAFAVGVLRAAVPKGHRIVAVESAFGNSHDKNLVEWAGRWAMVARDQFFFLVLVVALTLAARFGTPATERIKELGARSMVDAMGANLGRLSNPSYAMHLLLADVYERVRVALRAPVGTPRAELLNQMPVELAQQVQICEAMTQDGRPSIFHRRNYVLKLVENADRLDQATAWFEKDSRTRRLG